MNPNKLLNKRANKYPVTVFCQKYCITLPEKEWKWPGQNVVPEPYLDRGGGRILPEWISDVSNFFNPRVYKEEGGGGGGGGGGKVDATPIRFFSNFSKTVFRQHLPFSVAVCLSLILRQVW